VAKRTLIVGLGSTGFAAARFLTARGESVRVIDSRQTPPCLNELREHCPGVEVVLGSLDARWLDGIGRVILSPGLELDVPVARAAVRLKIPLDSEIELFARAARAPVLAVTGSNGKSTVATLAARMLEARGMHAPAGGNLGPPALDLLAERDAGAYVLEISSFQMETTHSLAPRAAAVLNVSADHLDRHGSVEQYAALKAKLLAAAELGVFNRDDPRVRVMGERHDRPMPFSVETPLPHGYSIVTLAGARWLARDGQPLLATAELALRGRHNEANALAALALTDAFGAADEPALEVLRTFTGLPHRCQTVAVRRGVTFLDDSKGTNVGATVAALQGLSGPLILIAGGVGKGADFEPLADAARGRVKAAVLIGEAAPALEAALRPVCATSRAESMAAAVGRAAALAAHGDMVLLSPACASQDMFRDYRDRGEQFARAVRELAP
jgi:UDP-N-acetylmuramoylalanine--D-glutamate ligase